MTTSPIPTIVSTTTNGKWTHKIIVPANAPEIIDAANKTLTFIGADPNSITFSDLGISELWSAFSTLSGIY